MALIPRSIPRGIRQLSRASVHSRSMRSAKHSEHVALGDDVYGRQTVRVTSAKAARRYIASLGRKNPGAKFEVTAAETISTYPGRVHLPVAIGGDDFFRSALKTALSFASGRGCP